MNKKSVVFIVIIAILSFLIIACNQLPIYVGTFSLDDYQEEIETFPFSRVIGEIQTAQNAVVGAKSVWREVFPDSSYGFPYYVYYDADNQAWLVCASVLFFFNSGPRVIFSQQDGQVLALWGVKF